MLVETEHPRYGTVKQLASPVRVGSEIPEYRRAPQRNEHAQEILTQVAGYDEAKIAELKAAGAFGAVKNS